MAEPLLIGSISAPSAWAQKTCPPYDYCDISESIIDSQFQGHPFYGLCSIRVGTEDAPPLRLLSFEVILEQITDKRENQAREEQSYNHDSSRIFFRIKITQHSYYKDAHQYAENETANYSRFSISPHKFVCETRAEQDDTEKCESGPRPIPSINIHVPEERNQQYSRSQEHGTNNNFYMVHYDSKSPLHVPVGSFD